ncbi:beta-1,3-galactosyltransferase 1-like [Brevipalpus obovatus]|uniref:beta-1,3-galactosyltransferase 1-like n=1 Tax=Brevipalpus obovatus TaxID=246614 RepID=UPI003D9E90C1
MIQISILKLLQILLILPIVTFFALSWIYASVKEIHQSGTSKVFNKTSIPSKSWSEIELSNFIWNARLIVKPNILSFDDETSPFFRTKLTVFVTTSEANLDRRKVIRKTWGSWFRKRGHQVFFVIGKSSSPGAKLRNHLISKEDRNYRDIIQYDFEDSYMNLTLKSLFMLRFFNEAIIGQQQNNGKAFPQAEHYLLKADDDVIFSGQNVLQWINQYHENRQRSSENYGIILGRVSGGKRPIRNPSLYHYVPETVYSSQSYPDFTIGCGYLMNIHAAQSIYRAAIFAHQCPFLPLEDVFLTGICASKTVNLDSDYEPTKIQLVNSPDFVILSPKEHGNFCDHLTPNLTMYGHRLTPPQILKYGRMLLSLEKSLEFCRKRT